jgi:hypothetical protein
LWSPCLIDWGKIMHPTYPTKRAYVEANSGRVQAPDWRRGGAVQAGHHRPGLPGTAVQVETMKPMSKAPGTKRLKQ